MIIRKKRTENVLREILKTLFRLILNEASIANGISPSDLTEPDDIPDDGDASGEG